MLRPRHWRQRLVFPSIVLQYKEKDLRAARLARLRHGCRAAMDGPERASVVRFQGRWSEIWSSKGVVEELLKAHTGKTGGGSKEESGRRARQCSAIDVRWERELDEFRGLAGPFLCGSAVE